MECKFGKKKEEHMSEEDEANKKKNATRAWQYQQQARVFDCEDANAK